eukprot:gene4848-34606_t
MRESKLTSRPPRSTHPNSVHFETSILHWSGHGILEFLCASSSRQITHSQLSKRHCPITEATFVPSVIEATNCLHRGNISRNLNYTQWQLDPSGCGAPPIPAPLPIFANDFGVSQFNVTLLNGYGWYFDTLQLYRRMNGSIHFVTDFGTVMNNRAEVGTKLNVNLAKLPGGNFAPGEELIFAIHVCKTGPKDFEGCNETQGLNACVGAGCNKADTCGTGCTMISDIGTGTGCGNCGGDIGQCNGDVFYFSGIPTNNIDNVTHVNVVNDGQPTVYLGFEDCRPPSGNCGDICYEDFQFKLDFIDNESITPCPNVNCDDGNPCTNDQRRLSGCNLGASAR